MSLADLIARLEELYRAAYDEDGNYIEGDWHRLEKLLAETTIAMPAILHALKVQQAAEEWEQSRQNAGNRASPEAERALSLAVKGEQE